MSYKCLRSTQNCRGNAATASKNGNVAKHSLELKNQPTYFSFTDFTSGHIILIFLSKSFITYRYCLLQASHTQNKGVENIIID